MAANPPVEAQEPTQDAEGPQEDAQELSGGYLDKYGHPDAEYVAGCMAAAAVLCKDSLAAQENAADPDAAQKFGAAAFGFAQAYEKFAGKAPPPIDPNKVQALDEKARQSDVKHGLGAAKQIDDQAHKDQQLAQDAAKTVLDHGQKQQQAQDRAEQLKQLHENPPQQGQGQPPVQPGKGKPNG
jgi:hypothetical protein